MIAREHCWDFKLVWSVKNPRLHRYPADMRALRTIPYYPPRALGLSHDLGPYYLLYLLGRTYSHYGHGPSFKRSINIKLHALRSDSIGHRFALQPRNPHESRGSYWFDCRVPLGYGVQEIWYGIWSEGLAEGTQTGGCGRRCKEGSRTVQEWFKAHCGRGHPASLKHQNSRQKKNQYYIPRYNGFRYNEPPPNSTLFNYHPVGIGTDDRGLSAPAGNCSPEQMSFLEFDEYEDSKIT